MALAAAVPAPGWVVALLVVAGAALGWWTSRALGTLAYRLDDERDRGRPAPAVLVAVAVPVLWGLLAWRVGGVAAGAALPAYLLLAWLGVALVWVDLDVHRLPEGLTLPALPVLLVLLAVASAVAGDWGALLRAVLCGVAAWVLFVLLALVVPGGLGLGDATLAGVVALPLGWLGWDRPLVALVVTYVVGGLVALGGLVTRRLSLRSQVAFGPFIVLGALVATLVEVRLS